MRRSRRPRILSFLGAVVALGIAAAPIRAQLPPYGGADAYLADLASRRAAIMQALGSDTVLVLWSAPERVYSADINYEYRQESDLFYLAGLTQTDSILVIMPGAAPAARAAVFTSAPDAQHELWFGHILTTSEVTAQTGIARVYTEQRTEAFDAFINALFGQTTFRQTESEASADFGPLWASIRAGKARLAVLDPPGASGLSEDPDAALHQGWLQTFASKFPTVKVVGARPLLNRQREIKTAYEEAVLRHSTEISARAQIEGMKVTQPGRWEYEVQAAIEHYSLQNGALHWGYPSIVASGPNATTLHYLSSTRQMKAGELLLVDAASSFQGITGDITRTYPVSGKFSSDERALYELVLEAQEAGMAAARPGASPDAVTNAARATFALGLPKLGLVDRTSSISVDQQVGLWFPHSPIHGIGVDVHDPLELLNPGAAFTIEPGLYIRPDALKPLQSQPGGPQLVEALKPAVTRFANIGVRLEDSFLMTPTGPEMLSSAAPRRVEDLEKVVGTGR